MIIINNIHEKVKKANISFGAKYLCLYIHQYIIDNNSDFNLTSDEISEQITASRSSIARWLNELKEEKLIKTKILGIRRFISME